MGASLGVKGARLTMTPRGSTYITVGSHGFYYRETLSRRGGDSAGPTPAPETAPDAPPADEIVTADVADLVDSSSEALIESLNERAQMFNPAWIVYAIAAALSIGGFVALSSDPVLPGFTPPLPAVTTPFSAERTGNTADEYAMILNRCGEPDSVLTTELGTVPVGYAHYHNANLSIVFVPNGCVEAYSEGLRSSSRRSGKGRIRSTARCMPKTNNTGWTIVGYTYDRDNMAISRDKATGLLNKITVKRTSPPSVEGATGQGSKQKPSSGSPAKGQTRPRPELQSDEQARAVEAQMTRQEQARQNAEAAQRRGQYSGFALLLGSLGLFVLGGVAHTKNSAKRTSRLFYELDETQRQKFDTVQQALTHLSKSERIWRVDADTATSDWKRHAGASSLVRRRSISVGYSCPPRVETNVRAQCVNTGDLRLFFLPDLILLLQGGRFGSVSYDDFRVQQGSTKFIEDGYVAADATVVYNTPQN